VITAPSLNGDAVALLTTPVLGVLWPLAGCPACGALRASRNSWRYHSGARAPLAEKGAAVLAPSQRWNGPSAQHSESHPPKTHQPVHPRTRTEAVCL